LWPSPDDLLELPEEPEEPELLELEPVDFEPLPLELPWRALPDGCDERPPEPLDCGAR